MSECWRILNHLYINGIIVKSVLFRVKERLVYVYIFLSFLVFSPSIIKSTIFDKSLEFSKIDVAVDYLCQLLSRYLKSLSTHSFDNETCKLYLATECHLFSYGIYLFGTYGESR